MLQDLATVGSELRGKRVAISVSPPWFFLHDRTPDFYAPNFSLLHLSGLVFSTDLSYGTKQLYQGKDLLFSTCYTGCTTRCFLIAHAVFTRWNGVHRIWRDTLVWRVSGSVLTSQFVCFGFLIFRATSARGECAATFIATSSGLMDAVHRVGYNIARDG